MWGANLNISSVNKFRSHLWKTTSVGGAPVSFRPIKKVSSRFQFEWISVKFIFNYPGNIFHAFFGAAISVKALERAYIRSFQFFSPSRSAAEVGGPHTPLSPIIRFLISQTLLLLWPSPIYHSHYLSIILQVNRISDVPGVVRNVSSHALSIRDSECVPQNSLGTIYLHLWWRFFVCLSSSLGRVSAPKLGDVLSNRVRFLSFPVTKII